MTESSRRNFLTTAAAALAAGAASPLRGANDRVNLAIVGLGGRGRDHIEEYSKLPDARIAAVCDVNQEALERGQAQVLKLTGSKPKGYADMRQVFDDKEIQAVSMPLPNHWHALATIWACQAGKDVYIEKPACHNPYEGVKMVEAARKYNRMVQVGSQGRSMAHKIKAIELLHQGAIGKVYMAKGLCYKRRPSIGHKPDGPVPPGLDWDKFLGPAPMRPFNELRFKYNWHWFWDTGNGDIGNQGVHEMDIARWGLGRETLPTRVVSTGGKFIYNDDQETPNTQIATFDYGDAELVFEVRGIFTGSEGGLPIQGHNTVGNLFFGSDGWMALNDNSFTLYKGANAEPAMVEKSTARSDAAPHMENFLAAVRSRKYRDLHAEVQIGVTSADLCHLANISYRLKRSLEFDPSANRFPKDDEANRMMTRKYRAPYVVPEHV
ncbi:MAG TPA: gfo/Idh/MocA family oxidoreductase [Solibacterales bacterium]|nr:gfo/Idh/MocA family oxidoreductase [Bryobacterales bacterium]